MSEQYKPGDIVNNHVLGHDNQWHPVGAPSAPPVPQKGFVSRHPVLTVVGGLFAFMMFIGAVGSAMGGEKDEDSITLADTTATSAEPNPSAPATSQAPVSTPQASATPSAAKTTAAPKPKPTKTKPALTRAQENAVGTAQDYLDYSGFSKKGLIRQLEFEGYERKDIDVALSTIKVNWKAEAVETAEAYLDYTNFSRSGLIEQLEFEGYTSEQARYAVSKVGL